MRRAFLAIASLVAAVAIIPTAIALAQPGPEDDGSGSDWEASNEWWGHHQGMMGVDDWSGYHDGMHEWMAEHWDEMPMLYEEFDGPMPMLEDAWQRPMHDSLEGSWSDHCPGLDTDRAAAYSLRRGPQS